MTFREKLKREHPEMVNERYIGGCKGCPSGYGYGDNMPNCSHVTCAECWNREIPGSEALEKRMSKLYTPDSSQPEIVM